jgi:hypothetical protein
MIPEAIPVIFVLVVAPLLCVLAIVIGGKQK